MSFVPREKLKLTTRADTAKPPADIKKEEKRKTVLNPRRRTETAVKEIAEKNIARNIIFLKKTELLWKGPSLVITRALDFVEVEDQEQDIFIPENDTGSAMHQDKVQILVRNGHKEGKRPEGVVLKVLERGMPSIVGTYQSSRDYGFVTVTTPSFPKIFLFPERIPWEPKTGIK